jgi:SIT4-associating protein SAP185/190
LNIAPSRARRQLAARLALHRQQAAEAAANPDKASSDLDTKHMSRVDDEAEPWQSNPFVISGLDDESGSLNFQFSDSSSLHRDGVLSSPTFPRTGFTPPGSPSTASSDGDESTPEAVRRKVRIPLEVDDDGDEEEEDDDDDDMGEMVAPSSGPDMIDSDEETEAIMNETFGYSNFFGTSRYGGLGRSHMKNTSGRSHFDDDADAQNDSSDGEGDDGLVEILFPGRKTSGSN